MAIFEAKMVEEFTDYWHSLPKVEGTLMPSRDSLQPNKIKALLPHVFMSELTGDRQVVIRLTGTVLDMISAQNLTGMNYLDICPEDERDQYWDISKNVAYQPCAHWMVRDVTFVDGKGFRLEGVTYPMVARDPKNRMLIGIMGANRNTDFDGRTGVGFIRSKIRESKFLDLGAGLPS